MSRRFRTPFVMIPAMVLLLLLPAMIACGPPLPPKQPSPVPRPPESTEKKREEGKREKKHEKKAGKKWYQEGVASWYGRKFHGRKTASGERYDMYGVSAAHKTLPFGTIVLVRNLNNGREVKVRINDRGPFVKGRIIDLSYGAAKKLGMIGDGIVPVKIRIIRSP